jgi:HD superfamily phosphohydrolase
MAQRTRNVRDPVWGEIELTDQEWRIVGLPVFQRLRRVHQLGLTMLVFPGATHTRFEHSLGACHAAGLISRQLEADPEPEVTFTPEDRRLTRLAALVHDLGHGPFSHVSDPLFDGTTNHEAITALFIETDPGLRAVLGDELGSRVAAILRGSEKRRTVVRDIVSGPADADKVDYLLRDSHYAGVEAGRFDHRRFIDQVRAINARPDSLLGFRWGGLWAVEGMLLARHHMHRTVYGHRNRLVTDFMLQRAMRAGIADGWLPSELFRPPADGAVEGYLARYIEWDDWRVSTAGAHATGVAGDLFRRLREHRLLKVLVYLEDMDLAQKIGFETARLLSDQGLKGLDEQLEARLAPELGVDPSLLIARLENPATPLVRPGNPALRTHDIVVQDMEDRNQQLNLRSEFFSALSAPTPRLKLFIYGPEGRRQNPLLAERATGAAVEALRAIVAEEAS